MRRESITYLALKYLKTYIQYQLNKSEKEEPKLKRTGASLRRALV